MLQRIILTILSYNLKKDWCYQKNEINVIKISLEKNSTSKLTFNIETARCFPSPNVSSTFELWYTWAHIVKQKFSNKRRRYRSLYENGTLEIQTTPKINLTPLSSLLSWYVARHSTTNDRHRGKRRSQSGRQMFDPWKVLFLGNYSGVQK